MQPEEERQGPAWRPGIVATLFLVCLVPRAVAAWNSDVLWGDSVHYAYASAAIEEGHLDEGFAEFGLNVYPLILIPLRHLGIDWQISAKWFNVLAASLAVVPLWGWLRRMFDDRLALLACLVYALHGKLIAISPLIIRDATFWLLMVLALYYSWRAVEELRLRHFLAAGIALTLAIHTRTEGWLLLIPLVGWAGRRCVDVASEPGGVATPRHIMRDRRVRLAAGCLLCIAVIPAAMTLVNVTWLRDCPRWEFLRPIHIRFALDWWNAASGMHVRVPQLEGTTAGSKPYLETMPPRLDTVAYGVKAAAISAPIPAVHLPFPSPMDRGASSWMLTFKLLERFAKGCTWIGSVLLLVGLVRGSRMLLRPEHLTLCCMSLCLLLIARIRYWAAGLDLRYFMPIVIVGVPWMALGLEEIIAAALRMFRRLGVRSPRALWAVINGLATAAVACSLLDAPMSATDHMRKHAALGRWIYDHAGPEAAIAGNLDFLSLDAFYANGRVVEVVLPGKRLAPPMPAALAERRADVFVLWNEGSATHICLADLERQITSHCKYRRVCDKLLPAGGNELMVLLRVD